MKDCQFRVQEAVFNKLSAAPAITSTVADRIYDSPPDEAEGRFLTIGDLTVADDSTKSTTYFDVTLVVHSWAQGESKVPVLEIMLAVVQTLDAADLEISGSPANFRVVSCAWQSSGVSRDPNGRDWHGTQRFRLLVEELAEA